MQKMSIQKKRITESIIIFYLYFKKGLEAENLKKKSKLADFCIKKSKKTKKKIKKNKQKFYSRPPIYILGGTYPYRLPGIGYLVLA